MIMLTDELIKKYKADFVDALDNLPRGEIYDEFVVNLFDNYGNFQIGKNSYSCYEILSKLDPNYLEELFEAYIVEEDLILVDELVFDKFEVEHFIEWAEDNPKDNDDNDRAYDIKKGN